ncbi:MAG TPA: DNA-binding response regulator [Candidatus Marinimicrobia bacterium]|nr:MAG: DNA-binding response regulator [Candidatus Marinimicrobia bacterium CG1_02_48_14]PIZ61846.1 MAG: DNA-binding response regulator [Candidatus Marinimicrobia bacterium CG_4_10_14_0_2_um_filter_48_9]PJA51762.1 MAG: DNA-binding response regulator [Candidatus Marinimicrobia bacterium CG_4_9_14_3_um_filter_48_9]HCW76506.1 DNA-binding response regulator [Candidatus Neomarinimicrobiota bacterium]
MNKTVLLIEDDPEIIEVLQENLKFEGFDTVVAIDGNSGIEKARRNDYAMILLDWTLPEIMGIDLLKKLRDEKINTPVIMLTARHSELDKVQGLEYGCDDYITKPFGMKELVARMNAVLRRYASRTEDERTEIPQVTRGAMVIDMEKHKVYIGDREVQLTATEFDLLALLARQPGRVYSRKKLLDLVWDYSYEGYENTVNTHVNRLRAKIEDDPNKPKYVLTVWGVGYKFTEELAN